MFISSTNPIFPDVFLLTLGATCRYAIRADDGALALSDPGASAHIPALLERLQRCGLRPSDVRYVLLTHLDADRIAGLALLRRHAPALTVCGSPQMQNQLSSTPYIEQLFDADLRYSTSFRSVTPSAMPDISEFKEALRIDTQLTDGSSLALGSDTSIDCIWSPGHSSLSLTYQVAPYGLALVDETFGYYRGKDEPAPGADYRIDKALSSITKLLARDISSLGLPYSGVLTGELVQKHLQSVIKGLTDLPAQYKTARKRGLSKHEFGAELRVGAYAPVVADPCLRNSLERSLTAVLDQIAR
jgi:glyoxylase-like metal-dependent hydrolase (beta-lactamase superfamily II)